MFQSMLFNTDYINVLPTTGKPPYRHVICRLVMSQNVIPETTTHFTLELKIKYFDQRITVHWLSLSLPTCLGVSMPHSARQVKHTRLPLAHISCSTAFHNAAKQEPIEKGKEKGLEIAGPFVTVQTSRVNWLYLGYRSNTRWITHKISDRGYSIDWCLTR